MAALTHIDFSFGVSKDAMKGVAEMDESRIIALFEEFMHNSKSKPYGHITINADGKLHRFRIDGDRAGTKNGAYRLHTDGRPNGYVMNWKDGFESREHWTYGFTDDERREYAQKQNDPVQKAKTEQERKEREARKAKELKRQQEEQERRRAMALAEYKNAWQIEPCQHAYLKAKFDGTDITYLDDGQFTTRYNDDYNAITNYPPKLYRGTIDGGICKPGELLVPTQDILTGAFNSLIRIAGKPDCEGHWYKKNYTGISPNGAAFIIRPEHAKTEAVYVCEGFATAFAIMVDLRSEFIVMAAGSCGNLSHVCKALRTRLTNTKITIVADNDKAGIKAAEQCVKDGLAHTYTMPDDNGLDWCDDLIQRYKKGANNNG